MRLEDHIERLYGSKKETEENLQNRRKELNQLVDPVTGQEFFKPRVGRPPKSQRNAPITEYLYAMREKKVSQTPKHSEMDLAGKSRSDEILTKRKRARYLEIFTLLNPHECDKIYSEVINIQEIDVEIVKILMPLLQELEDTGEKIDFDEFFDSMENLCKTLTPEERHTLLKERIRPIELEKPEKRSCSSGRIYTRTKQYKADVEAKLLAERIRRSEEEVKECSFHPKIKKYRRESKGRTQVNF